MKILSRVKCEIFDVRAKKYSKIRDFSPSRAKIACKAGGFVLYCLQKS